MDAFAVATCRGLEMKKFNIKQAIVIALFFGLFQAGMPLLGWAVGIQFSGYIETYDHWIAFGLLCFLGVKMIIDSFKKEEVENLLSAYKDKELHKVMVHFTSLLTDYIYSRHFQEEFKDFSAQSVQYMKILKNIRLN